MKRVCWTSLCAAVLAGGVAPAQKQSAPAAAASFADIAAGKRVFDSQCALCHGIGGAGGRGPALTAAKLHRAANEEELVDLIVNGIEGSGMPAFWFLGERSVLQVAAYVRSLGAEAGAPAVGNIEHGKAVYAANGCPGCHVLQGAGSAYGPELTGIGARRSAAFIRESIVDPSASTPDDFVVVRATLRGGANVTGVRLNEDSFTIQLRDAAGRFYSFRKQDLAELQKDFGESPMPSYRGRLSDSDIGDLVAWMASLKETP